MNFGYRGRKMSLSSVSARYVQIEEGELGLTSSHFDLKSCQSVLLDLTGPE